MGSLKPVTVVTRVSNGTYRVESGGRAHLVYVAGSPPDQWAFWNGEVFYLASIPEAAPSSAQAASPQSLRAPMPSTVVQVLVQPGSTVRAGDSLIVLEAMKMELVLRAPADGTIAAVRCRERDVVQPNAILIDFA